MLRSTVPHLLTLTSRCEHLLRSANRTHPLRAQRAGSFLLGCLLLALATTRGAAYAQPASPPAKAAAEALFDQGLSLMRDGQYAEACKRLESSQTMDPAIGTMLYLADCYEKQGRIASAWALFREASSAASQSGQDERADAGKQRADQLESQLSTLIVEVPQEHALPEMVVNRNGIVLPAASWGIAIPVDPGQHKVSVSAPGRITWEKTITIDRNTAQTTISVPLLEVAAEPVPPVEEVVVNEQSPVGSVEVGKYSSDDRASARGDDGDTQRIIGVVVGGAGLATLGVSAFFGHRAISRATVVEDLCGSSTICTAGTPQDLEKAELRQSQAEEAATVANVLAIAGAAATVGGALLYFLAPEESEHIAFEVSPTTAALHLRGAF